jgi:hypothetical protein
MPKGAPEESWGDRQLGGFPHPEKGKPGGRVKETQQRVSRPTGTAGPLRGSAPSTSREARSRLRMIPPPKKRPSPNPRPTPGRGGWSRGGASRGGQSQRGAARMQPPRRPPLPDPGRMPGPLQLMGPGDHPMQRLALMMAVMMLGMPPVKRVRHQCGPQRTGNKESN